jgi:diacylglycerol kinase (ATP)
VQAVRHAAGIKSALQRAMARALLIRNPNSRRGESLQAEIEATLRNLQIDFVDGGLCPSPEAITRALSQFPSDRIIVAGGDGTVKCAAESLLGRQIPLGIIPTGTANNLARTLLIPESVAEACAVIARGKSMSIDLARVNGAYFVSVAGIGISTQVHRNVDSRHKRVFGPIAYGWEALRSLLGTGGFRIKIKTEREVLWGRAIQLTVCNGRNFGAVLEVSDDASVTDHKLDALVIEQVRWFRGILNTVFPRKNGQGVHHVAARRIEVRAWPKQLIDVEGKIVGTTPAHFEVIPNAIKVLVPEEVAKAA